MKKSANTAQEVFRFTGIVERFSEKGGWHFVRFPFSAEEHFGTRGTVRMMGTLNGITIDRALMPDGHGGHFIALSTDLRRQAGLRLGYEAKFVLQKHDAPDRIILPEEMEAVFEQMPDARAAFKKFTPGLQRSLMSYITSGKRAETREKRALMLAQRFESGYYDAYLKQ